MFSGSFHQSLRWGETGGLRTLGEVAERRYTLNVSASLLISAGPIFYLLVSQLLLAKGKRLGAVCGPSVSESL